MAVELAGPREAGSSACRTTSGAFLAPQESGRLPEAGVAASEGEGATWCVLKLFSPPQCELLLIDSSLFPSFSEQGCPFTHCINVSFLLSPQDLILDGPGAPGLCGAATASILGGSCIRSPSPTRLAYTSEKHPRSTFHELNMIRKHQDLCDVMIHVGSRKILAHKYVIRKRCLLKRSTLVQCLYV